MRHAKKRLQLNRFTSWHKATLIAQAKNILRYQSIRTTLHRAKASRRLVERLISLAKDNTLAAKRKAYQILGEHKLVSLLFKEIGPRFQNRQSGFTRIINLGARRGDNAEVVIFELTEIKKKEKKVKKEKVAKVDHTASSAGEPKDRPSQETKPDTNVAVKERPPIEKKPTRKFLGGLRNVFKKERDSL